MLWGRGGALCAGADLVAIASGERQWSLDLRDALAAEYQSGIDIVVAEGQAGAARFVAGGGRVDESA